MDTHRHTQTHKQYLGRAGRWPWAARVPLRACWVSSNRPGTSPAALRAPECGPLERTTRREGVTSGKHIVLSYWRMNENTHTAQELQRRIPVPSCSVYTSLSEDITSCPACVSEQAPSVCVCGCFIASMKIPEVETSQYKYTSVHRKAACGWSYEHFTFYQHVVDVAANMDT